VLGRIAQEVRARLAVEGDFAGGEIGELDGPGEVLGDVLGEVGAAHHEVVRQRQTRGHGVPRE
jgi:hypothetical protein